MTKITSPPAQHDSAWKNVLDVYFPEFMAFFYPDIAQAINWQIGYDTLDNELQTITTQSMIGKRVVDKLFRVQLRQGGERWLLIHVEAQTACETQFELRLFRYYYRLYDRYNQPIITLAILADNNPTWRPHAYQAQVLGREVLTFRFLTTKLLDYQAKVANLEATSNPFGIIVLAHLLALKTRKNPALRFEHKFSLTKQLYDRGLQRDAILTLYAFIDWVMTLPDDLEIRYNESIHQLEEERAMSYITSAERIGMKKGFEQGLLQGIEKGKQEGKQEGRQEGRQEGEYILLLKQLMRKFGEVPPAYHKRLEQADADTLLTWGEHVLDATQLEDVFSDH